jgi:hypothetical protein
MAQTKGEHVADFLTRRLGQPIRINLTEEGDDEEYFVVLRPMTKGDLNACQDSLARMSMTISANGNAVPSGDVHMSAYDEELVCRSIIEWNLDGPGGVMPYGTDRDGRPTPQCRASYRALPAETADKILDECRKLNKLPTGKEDLPVRDDGTSEPERSESLSATSGDELVSAGVVAVEGTGANSQRPRARASQRG